MENVTVRDDISSGKSANVLGMWCHLGAFAGVLIPFANFLVPFLIWITKKDEYEFVDDQGKESLNFQISLLIYSMIGAALAFLIVGLVFLVVVAFFAIIQVIKAAIAASNGIRYRYPFCFRFIK
jgi:uncharacterized protein